MRDLRIRNILDWFSKKHPGGFGACEFCNYNHEKGGGCAAQHGHADNCPWLAAQSLIDEGNFE